MNVKTAIVPVAGLGTRLLPISAATPKELLPLGRFPALHYIASELGRAGVERIILVTSDSKAQIANYFQPNPALEARLEATGKHEFLNRLWSKSEFASLRFETVIQQEQNGLGHAVLCAADRVPGEPVVVALGDCVMGMRGESSILTRLVQTFESEKASACIGFEQVPLERVSRYGIAAPATEPNAQNIFRIRDLVEKPDVAVAPSQFAIAARYVLAPEIFSILSETGTGQGGEIQLTDAIRQLIREQDNAFGIVMDEPRFDVGNLQTYLDAVIRFANDDDDLKPVLAKAISELGLSSNP